MPKSMKVSRQPGDAASVTLEAEVFKHRVLEVG